MEGTEGSLWIAGVRAGTLTFWRASGKALKARGRFAAYWVAAGIATGTLRAYATPQKQRRGKAPPTARIELVFTGRMTKFSCTEVHLTEVRFGA